VKSPLLPLAFVAWLVPATAQAGDLTVHDLVELHRAGLGDDVLLALIEVDGGPFELDPAQLLDLKADGLSDRIVAALVRAGRQTPDAQPDAAPVPSSHTHGPVPSPQVYWQGGSPWQARHIVAVPTYVPVPVPVVGTPTGEAVATPTTGRPFTTLRSTAGSSFGARPAAVNHGVARTVDSIRHAPAGFHPGTIGPRPSSPTTDREP